MLYFLVGAMVVFGMAMAFIAFLMAVWPYLLCLLLGALLYGWFAEREAVPPPQEQGPPPVPRKVIEHDPRG